MFGGNFAPLGWAMCDGQLLSIAENETLFQLIGTTYGGDGQATFALPDLRGRVPVHMGSALGNTYQLAENGGVETVTLTPSQLPAHTHAMSAAAGVGHVMQPQGAFIAADRDYNAFRPAGGAAPMAAGSVASVGGSQPHDNLPPYLCINYIISLFGIFPSQT